MVPGFPLSLFAKIAEVAATALDLDELRSGPAPGDDPFVDGRADFGWICSTSFVDLSTRAPEPTVQLAGVAWVPDDPDTGGRPVYFGDVVVPQASPIMTLDDLGGVTIGCNDEISLSGHVAIRLALRAGGHDPDHFVSLRFTGGHHASLDQVISGEVDAAVIDSVVRTTRARTDPAVAGLRIIERLGPWPVQPLVARRSLDNATVRRVGEALLASNNDPEMQRELAAASLTRFVAVGPDHYEPVRAALARM